MQLNSSNKRQRRSKRQQRPSVRRKSSTSRASVRKNRRINRLNRAYKNSQSKQVNNSKTHNSSKPKRSLMLTRRTLLYGVLGAGILAAGGVGVKVASENIIQNTTTSTILEVKQSAVASSEDLTEDTQSKWFTPQATIDLPYGTLAWANDSNYICLLIPNINPKPLCSVALINIKTQKQTTIINKALNQNTGFDIYDVRANNSGIVWTETNILSGEWKVYISSLDNLKISPILVDEGTSDFDIPSVQVCNNNALWQINSKKDSDNKSTKNNSVLKSIPFAVNAVSDTTFIENLNMNALTTEQDNIIYISPSSFKTPIYVYENSIIVSPRAQDNTTYIQLTCLDVDGKVQDVLTLPQNMIPLEASYGPTGFNFSFDAIYTQGKGLSKLGTYVPFSLPANQEGAKYNSVRWFNFSRTPSAPPCWSNGYLVVRGTMSVCVCDINNNTYTILERPNASEDYGDYLVSNGNCDKFVTIANINNTKISGETEKKSTLRIWSKT